MSDNKSNKVALIIVGAVVGTALCLMCLCGIGAAVFVRLAAQTAVPPPLELQDEDYEQARRGFRTTLRRAGPSPQPADLSYQPRGAEQISYRSGELTLKAYVDPRPSDGQKRPAVLFLHGGFAFGDGDLEMPQPYRDAGYIVMVPVLRGENGQPGNFTLFYDEVDDVLGARDALAALEYVDADRLYVAGHSAGGTLTLLAAMASARFRAAASLSGSPDQRAFVQSQPEFAVFDTSDTREFQVRSPLAYASSFKCPVRLFYGSAEAWATVSTAETAQRARQRGLDAEAVMVPGDHFTSVPEAIRRSIEFFRAH
ncbi:MAG TPA: alpha/beta fold hydrolase [Pirellulales bacterium]|jgi:dipeptidyl aminopeptidase/acylaminoacyl peptidase|nr:alpha/beta fold hydrolase [Pirellulales bacterium]